ncbi:transcription-repair coupling factor [Agarilytica rhodophyticola]|uniref:transcription-repair coupling factor n=1 Tax=Agarilytica rhodophyticola TaxID=1737490 RepID=UPI000B348F4F|nr:transcription-repair coupling factor [Agarilytica rhodophyticola]
MKQLLLSPPAAGKPGDKTSWGNFITGSSMACAVAFSAIKHASSTVLIAPNMTVAERIAADLKQFLDRVEKAPQLEIFSDWETLPYDTFSPHQDIVSNRMRCLYRLAHNQRSIIIVTAQTLAQRLVPESYILSKSLILKKGDLFERDKFRDQLVFAGYNSVDTVYQHGEFALRGALIDVYPMGSSSAYRIELFDDEVESLREFDPETQRTISQVEKIELLPGKECPLDKKSIATFRAAWHERFDTDHKACPVYQDVNSGLSPAGIEYFLSLFFDTTASLLDYLPRESQLFVIDGFEKAYEEFWREAHKRYDSRCGDLERPILPPQEVFFPTDETFARFKQFPRVTLHTKSLEEKQGQLNFDAASPPLIRIDNRSKNPLHLLEELICNSDKRILFCAESSGRREVILEQLHTIGIEPASCDSIQAFLANDETMAITVAAIEEGINCLSPGLLLISEAQLFGTHVRQARRQKSAHDDRDNIIKNLTELKVGAPVVHIDHGVGRYKGLQSIEHDGQAEEFLVLDYANEAKLYVPVANLHTISRYSGSDEVHAPLHRLGNEQWQKAKRKAAEKVRDVAAELLEIYAKRQAKEGFTYSNPKEDYALFAAGFTFEETPDQRDAINAVRSDMLSPRPMDRLVCGDVGFGKTEVAMRAAFIAVQNSKQVAVLVPTTLLAQQHYENFKDRFADWPTNIEVISRFRSQKQITEIQKKLSDGKIDIIIGTHKLIQGELDYPNLGLVIIDEEHRFGVRQKEALKALRADVDILAMTATPIPRTLNMSMAGIRDLSIIATPPAKRLSVKTFVRELDKNLVKEAILREIMRGGQVYYLHNEVKTIEKIARELEEQIPEARVQIGHGQMRERELESVMTDFYHKRFNVLVCTTIIETGIDVPSANTIIINRADTFGLAQLHQLRGRVGRSHHQAYAYLLTPNKKAMTADAHKRLDAIAEAQDLGAGFTLASHDMEIRGAGELLGEEQSGQIQSIGFSLYMDMLDRAVKAIQNGEEISLEDAAPSGVEFNLRIPALIPDDYLPDVHTRLTLYKRISSTNNNDELNDLQVEMIDRFGLLPDATKNLFRQTRLRFEAEKLGIAKVDAGKTQGRLEFGKNTQVDPLTIVKLVQKQPQSYRLEGANHLKFMSDMETADERLKSVHHLFENLNATG